MISTKQKTFWLLLAPITLITHFVYAEDAKIIKNVILLKDHTISSPKTGSIQSGGGVKVLEKSGFWVKVESSGQIGWVKLSDIQLPSIVNNIDPLSTGRNATGNIVNTAGVRGLSPEDLKNSQPSPSSVDIAIQNASKVKDVDVSNFITSAGLAPKNSIPALHSVKTTMTGETQQSDQGKDDQSNVSKKTSDGKKDRESNENW